MRKLNNQKRFSYLICQLIFYVAFLRTPTIWAMIILKYWRTAWWGRKGGGKGKFETFDAYDKYIYL